MSFEIEVQEESLKEESPIKILPDSYIDNEYRAFQSDQKTLQQAKLLLEIQTIIKTESLLLEYQQKRKNERLKEIEYVYTNGFNNFLWEKNKSKSKVTAPIVIINRKDLLQIDEYLPDELEVFREALLNIKMNQVFAHDSKPNQAFLRDFYNIYPRWKSHISTIIEMEIEKAPKIQNAFESQYTFPSKVLSSLKYSANIHMFCSQIFRKSLNEIILYNEELSLDFYHIYQPWLTRIKGSADKGSFYNLYHFITKSDAKQIKNIKKIKNELCELMNIKAGESEKLISEMLHFSQNREAISHLFAELSSEQIDESNINIKLAVLVWKKIIANRKKIESILTLFIDEILNSYYIFPKEVKYIMREYYRIAKKKFGEVRFEDVKSFFNKVIYSQLLFPEFMGLLEDQNGVTANIKNFNIPIIALLSQKILFGQEFYEKAKYSYFNQLISHYSESIHNFMVNFLDEIHDYHRLDNEAKEVDPLLISFQSIAYLYENMRKVDKVPKLQILETKIKVQEPHIFGSSTFKPRDVYLVFINHVHRNYESVLKPRQKMKKIFIEFLKLIDKITQPIPFLMLLEQYKYAHSNYLNSEVQIHANYLSLVIEEINIPKLHTELIEEIQKVKKTCERVKINLEKEYNYAQNIEKVNMKKLKGKRKFNAMTSIHDFIEGLMQQQTGFFYEVHNGNVCEVEEGEMQTLEKCLHDIAHFYTNNNQGYDGLYHLLLEKISQSIEEQGIVLQQTMQSTKEIIGAKLFDLLNIKAGQLEEDRQIEKQMIKHNFTTLKLLGLPQYSDQQELIYESSYPLIEQLNKSQSADELLKILHEIVTVFQNIILINGKASDITADVQIPMMIYILTKSKLKNLGSLLNFIEKFSSQDIHSSVMGQTLTLMTSVKYLIHNFNAEQFSLAEQQYKQLVAEEEERLRAQTQGKYLIIDDDY